jgi:hypothetical protein
MSVAEMNALKGEIVNLRIREKLIISELKNISKNVDDVKLAVLGDPSDDAKIGIRMRLDRLEQKDRTRVKAFWILVSGVLTLALERVKAFL